MRRQKASEHLSGSLTYLLRNDTVLANGHDTIDSVAVLEALVVALDDLGDGEGVHGLVWDVAGHVALKSRASHAVTHVRVEANNENLDDHALGRRGELDLEILKGHVHIGADKAFWDTLVHQGLAGDCVGHCEGRIGLLLVGRGWLVWRVVWEEEKDRKPGRERWPGLSIIRDVERAASYLSRL